MSMQIQQPQQPHTGQLQQVQPQTQLQAPQQGQMKKADPNKAPNQIIRQAQDRLNQMGMRSSSHLGRKALGLLGGILALGVGVLKLGLSVTLGTLGDIGRAVINAVRGSKAEANRMREQLGTPPEKSVLSRSIPTKSYGETTVLDVMEQYRRDVGANITREQMEMYVNMGERICRHLNGLENYKGGPLEIPGSDGKMVKVRPGVETARAISWYLHAKTVLDNASTDRDPVVMKRGSMLLNDPSGKLFAFLRSAPNMNWRPSTHWNERSKGPLTHLFNTGVSGQLAMVTGNRRQCGIEDYSSRMPSGGGCLLFDQLEGPNGEKQMYLKWEEAGMPSVFGSSYLTDREAGLGERLLSRLKAPFRCLRHTFNFVESLGGKGAKGWGAHRESLGDAAKPIVDRFNTFLKDVQQDFHMDGHWADRVRREVKTYGVSRLAQHLDSLEEAYQALPPITRNKQLKELGELRGMLNDFCHEMGRDMGYGRRGSEVHVSLSDTPPQVTVQQVTPQVLTPQASAQLRSTQVHNLAQRLFFDGQEPTTFDGMIRISPTLTVVEGVALNGNSHSLEPDLYGVEVTDGVLALPQEHAREFAISHELGHLYSQRVLERAGLRDVGGQGTEVVADLISAHLLVQSGVSRETLLAQLEQAKGVLFDTNRIGDHPPGDQRIAHIRDLFAELDKGQTFEQAVKTIISRLHP